jgi:type IV pilus assembly protein PilV
MSTGDRSRRCHPAHSGGFTLLEVMVALVVTSIGLLGIAKLQALAYASTSSASARSLVALQAAGLAASMHANRGYWAAGAAPAPFTITGTVISDATLNSTATGASDCASGGAAAPCSPATMAAFDLHTYATALNAMLGNSAPVTTVNCPAAIPVNCTIQVTWNEHVVSINTQSVANTTQATFIPTFTLYVEP